MNEQQWLECTNPAPMLECLRGKASDRKLRLFAVACCRRFWPQLTDERSRKAVEVAEQYADGFTGTQELDAARLAASHVKGSRTPYNATLHVAYDEASDAAWEVATYLSGAFAPVPDDEQVAQAHLLRDIIGDPFRPVVLSPAWQDGIILRLAQGIYDERAFAQLPVLGDALEKAGCTNAGILSHCRSAGPHVRGCWVVDLILGKK